MYRKTNIKNIAQYKIMKPLSKGGYSDVLLVEDTNDLNKKYALKAIIDSSDKFRLQNEININKKISTYANILKLEKVFKYCNKWFFLFEYTPENDLEYQVIHNGIFDEETILNVLKDIVSVLKFTHTLNIIHNDIQPRNILS